MRHLLNTLYITSPDSYLAADGNNIKILVDGEEKGRVPLHNFEAIVTFGYAGMSPALMNKCLKEKIDVTFLSKSGHFKGKVTGAPTGNVYLRKTQYRVSENEDISLKIAKNFILGKIYNQRWVLERSLRDHSLRLDVVKLKKVSLLLQEALLKVQSISDLDSLRGIEGNTASLYFSVFDDLILQQKETFKFTGRSKRPPLDKVNALLSFTYTLLTQECAAALLSVGLDPYVGFMHQDRPGRNSLALDLVEELRSVYVDRFVLSVINKKILQAKDFVQKENGAVLLKEDSRRVLLKNWQLKKQDILTHPYLKEKIPWGLVPYAQAQLLARYLRNDLDNYPPFLWK